MAEEQESLHVASSGSAESDKLINYLLAAKRSLSVTSNVGRANEIVALARSKLEESVILGARMGFIRRGVYAQSQVLLQIRRGLADIAVKGETEFEHSLHELDVADAQLQQSLEALKGTPVEPSLGHLESEQKTLHDFVDDEGMSKLQTGLRESIDQVQTSQHEYAGSIKSFDEDFRAVKSALAVENPVPSFFVDHDTPIPSLLQNMESHAAELATLLQSLVVHFDLCVTAIKHTEGGGAAAQAVAGDLQEDLQAGQEGADAPTESISEEERLEMLQVLEKDADEVDDVVLEMNDRLSDMESGLNAINDHLQHLNRSYSDTTLAFQSLEELGARLPEYVAKGDQFLGEWEDQKRRIDGQLEELEALRIFYDGFLGAYDGLIIEVARRKKWESKMATVVKDATAKLDNLYEDDERERENFRQDQGEYLPSDIWAGLTDPPRRFEIHSVEDDSTSLPSLPKKAIDQALKRIQGRL